MNLWRRCYATCARGRAAPWKSLAWIRRRTNCSTGGRISQVQGHRNSHDRGQEWHSLLGPGSSPARALGNRPGSHVRPVRAIAEDGWLRSRDIGLRPGRQAIEQEIIGFTRERLARYKCPGTVDIIDALPRTPSGKVLKHTLRDPYWAGRDRQI